MNAAVLIPVKDFRQAKARLSSVLTPLQRVRLAQWTSQRVMAAAEPFPVFVACDDTQVAAWAEQHGATVLWRPGLGLNPAVSDGINTLFTVGFQHVIVAHSDLALATAFTHLLVPETLVLVPDTRGDGTNVMVVPAGSGIAPAYGSQSFQRHLAQAVDLHETHLVVHDPYLALDIDTPADLRHPDITKAIPAWLRTNLDNQTPTPTSGQLT